MLADALPPEGLPVAPCYRHSPWSCSPVASSGAIERRGRRSSSGVAGASVRDVPPSPVRVICGGSQQRLRHITKCAAYDALASTLPKGSALPMNCDRGKCFLQVETAVVDRIRAMRWPS